MVEKPCTVGVFVGNYFGIRNFKLICNKTLSSHYKKLFLNIFLHTSGPHIMQFLRLGNSDIKSFNATMFN